MMTRRSTYDPACAELAQFFLRDEPDLREQTHELAAHIQQAIEEWIARERMNREEEIKS